MLKTEFSIDRSEWRKKVRRIPMERRAKMRLVIEQTVREAVDKIKGYTGETAEPIRAGGPRRRKHIGGWADRTHNLRNSIGHELNISKGRIDVLIGVGMGSGVLGVSVDDVIEYAIHLDAMEGIDVLGGVPKQAFDRLVRNLKKVYND